MKTLSAVGSGSKSQLSKGEIAGIVVGTIVAVAIVIGVALYLRRRQQRRAQEIIGGEIQAFDSSSDVDLLDNNRRAVRTRPASPDNAHLTRFVQASAAPGLNAKALEAFGSIERTHEEPLNAAYAFAPSSSGTRIPLSVSTLLDTTRATTDLRTDAATIQRERHDIALPLSSSLTATVGRCSRCMAPLGLTRARLRPGDSSALCGRCQDNPQEDTDVNSVMPLSLTSLMREAGSNTKRRTFQLHADIIRLRQTVDAMRRDGLGQPPPRYAELTPSRGPLPPIPRSK